MCVNHPGVPGLTERRRKPPRPGVDVDQTATAALYRRITPTGTTLDGDVVFALCPHEGAGFPTLQVEALAVRVLEMAIERAVRLARGRDGIPGLADA